MQCPKCRYVLSDFDRECPRCKNLAHTHSSAENTLELLPTDGVPTHKKCPRCGRVETINAPWCEKCHRIFKTNFRVVTPLPPPPVSPEENVPPSAPVPSPQEPFIYPRPVSGVRTLGILLLVGGLCLAAYFFLFFDTSVPTQSVDIMGQTVGGERVNNIGLMADRQNGIIIGMGSAILGFLMMVLGGREPTPERYSP